MIGQKQTTYFLPEEYHMLYSSLLDAFWVEIYGENKLL